MSARCSVNARARRGSTSTSVASVCSALNMKCGSTCARNAAGWASARTSRSSTASRPDPPASGAGSPGSAANAGGDGANVDSGDGMTDPNYVAAVVAALSSFAIGGVWFSPLMFAKAWQREAGLTDEEVGRGAGRAYGGGLVLSLVVAMNLAFFLGGHAGIACGAGAGALAGIGWAAA